MNDENYECDKCCYKSKDVNFCGFCIKKIIKELEDMKKKEIYCGI